MQPITFDIDIKRKSTKLISKISLRNPPSKTERKRAMEYYEMKHPHFMIFRNINLNIIELHKLKYLVAKEASDSIFKFLNEQYPHWINSSDIKKELKILKERYEILGFQSMANNSPLQTNRLMVVTHLKEIHGNGFRVSTRSLHLLSPTIKGEARDWLMGQLGNNLYAVDICKNVFKKPRIKKDRDEDSEYSVGNIKY